VVSAEAAVRGADIVVTATTSKDPVLEASWVKPGALVVAMGSNVANRRELPEDLVRLAGLIAVDNLEQARIEAGDLLLANHWANVVELKDVKSGFDPHRVTIFESLGIAVEDAAAAAYVFEQAPKFNLGHKGRSSREPHDQRIHVHRRKPARRQQSFGIPPRLSLYDRGFGGGHLHSSDLDEMNRSSDHRSFSDVRHQVTAVGQSQHARAHFRTLQHQVAGSAV
jgi:hypothetical protein